MLSREESPCGTAASSIQKVIDEYIAVDGYKALGKVLTEMTPQQVIDVVKLPA